MRRLLLPSASMTNTCQSPPSRFDWKAIMEPSGDQAGKALSAFLSAVNWTALEVLLSGPMSMRPTGEVPPTDACTSTRRPSGEYEGGTGLTPIVHSPCAKTTRPPRTSATRTSAPASHSLLRRRAVEGRGRALSDRAEVAAVAGSGRAGLERE